MGERNLGSRRVRNAIIQLTCYGTKLRKVQFMPDGTASNYHRCYISAPTGLELGVLPELLLDRGIAWEWAKDGPFDLVDASGGMRLADFVLVVLNGTIADYRGVFEAGIAIGLGKPILLVQAHSRPLPIDLRTFTTVKAGLGNREALGFHLDLFLASPAISRSPRPVERLPSEALARTSRKREGRTTFETDLERRAYDAVIAAGGSAISEPRSDLDGRYRPDLLAWLGNVDAELLDPAVIEVRSGADAKSARQLEERLLSFMQSTSVRMALVLTTFAPPERDQQLSDSVLWMTIDKFEELARSARLGTYVRETRNRIMHGAR